MPSHNFERPRVGIALSGGATRAMAHIAVLEVLREHKIPIDYLVGCSSGAVVAVAFAAGTLDYFKEWMRSTDTKTVKQLWSRKNAKGGLFHLNNESAQEFIAKIVNGLTFETADPKLGIVASDVNTGELITISLGEVATALKASVAVPGFIEPVVWGGKILVDGGLASIVPTKPVRDMGADIVLGVNISPAKFIYEKKLPYWKVYRFFTRWMQWERTVTRPLSLGKKFLMRLLPQEESVADPSKTTLNSFQVLVRALDRSVEISDQYKASEDFCDLMISPDVKHYKKHGEFKMMDEIYEEGRRAALEAVPKIRDLISQFEKFDIHTHGH